MVVSLASTGGAAKIYCVNGGGMTSKNAAAWLEAKLTDRNKRRKRGGQGGTGGEGEIRLIQDFDFPEASNKIKTTRDGKYLMATGTYKPRMKVFDLEELSMKMERVTDSENVDFCILSSDWTKTLHLQSDRSLDLHTQSASHYSVRMPRQGRTLAYHFPTCDALVGGTGAQVWRLNLEVGRFMKPFGMEGAGEYDGGEGGGVGGGMGAPGDFVTGVNAIDINPAHQLMCFGTDTALGRGTVELWDPRSRSRAGILRLPYNSLLASSMSSASLKHPRLPGVDDDGALGGVAVTALSNKSDGLNLAVGTSTGHVLLYDLRASKPYTTKDQGYGLPVKKVEWVESAPATSSDAEREGGWVASADEKVVKIWGKETGTNLVAINPPIPVNDLHIYPGTGLVFLANETSPMTGYYVPQLGPAPKWARFLDNMTEEMEDDQETLVYDDYKFVDRQELDDLNLTHLIGTDTLKPYMHGYFVDLRLYTKARAIANPFQYAEHRDKLIRDKLAAEQESRIRGAKKAAGAAVAGVKVNKQLARRAREAEEKLRKREAGEEDEDDEEGRRKRKKKVQAETPSLLKDDRFADLFTNPDFEIDEASREFQLLNPSTKPSEEEDASNSDSSAEGDLGFDHQRRPVEPPQRPSKPAPSRPAAAAPAKPALPRPTLVAADDSDDETLSAARSRPLAAVDRASQTLAQRARQAAESGSAKRSRRADEADSSAAADENDIIRGTPGGGMEMFGMGLERSRGAPQEDEQQRQLEDEEDSGRKRMRKPARSASRNKTRFL
ncbi:nucleolar rRNA processing-related protein [Rhodotorula toruloides ATCC 204091]|uniref:BY PROTMAP: gi/342319709/gb/EGU11656.1/ nucleolar rRNA processing-related protein [Rhodotorula glutinis ATCC 204091] n=1 Tax=Rhodotorula toruloides TaxID=5286 RepID=A0A0K3CG78_RHOTO|nr:nucleolar rRNA processing-related protein [Rhodotorula toruloides ATCC 204091]